ncbi:MAG: serine hydrolase [bacterium]|nr:serine hydrolase [bacterium]
MININKQNFSVLKRFGSNWHFLFVVFCLTFGTFLFPHFVFAGILGPEKGAGYTPYPMENNQFTSAIVVDVESGMILYTFHDEAPWSGASLTKLMSSYVFLQHEPIWEKIVDLRDVDDVGGGKLWVKDGATLSEQDLFYSAITASANNAATAMPRILGIPLVTYLDEMNTIAKSWAMRSTMYVGVAGMEPENMTSARDIAKLAWRVFRNDVFRRASTVSTYDFTIRNSGEVKSLKNTNYLVTKPEYDDVFVTGGKTGFLYESMYNLVVQLRPTEDKDSKRTLIVVVFGSQTRDGSFESARSIARWTWDNFEW